MPEPTKPTTAPKINESGTVKSPTSGSTLNASFPEKSGVITGDKSSGKEESKLANTPTAKTIAEDKRTAENKASEETPAKEITELKGEVLQGDSFRISFKRGNMSFQIPVPIQGTDNVVVLDNTFRIIDAIQKAGTRKELEDKFASFIE